MNTYFTFACLLAVAASAHGSGYGLGYGGLGYGGLGYGGYAISAPILAPAAVSTANLIKAAPIPIVKTIVSPVITKVVSPIISAPVIKAVPIAPLGLGLGGLGYDGLGLGGLGYGYGKPLGLGYGLGKW